MTQNKVLPGAYINFVSRPRAMGSLGERGVVCVGMELDWGREGMTDIAAAEGRTNCRELFGYTYLSEEMKDLRVCGTVVSLRSALSPANEAQMEALSAELCAE